jgi:hypothetical protein
MNFSNEIIMSITYIIAFLFAITWLFVVVHGGYIVIRFQSRFRTQIAEAFPINKMRIVNTNPWLLKIGTAIRTGTIQDPDLIREYKRTVRIFVISLIILPIPIILSVLAVLAYEIFR